MSGSWPRLRVSFGSMALKSIDSRAGRPFLAAMCLLALVTGGCGSGGREHLRAGFLLGQDGLASPVPTQAYRPLGDAPPRNYFEGHLVFADPGTVGRHEVLVDLFDLAEDPALEVGRLPPFEMQFIQIENTLIPVQRGPQRSEHPHWEFIVEPGAVWDEPGDGEYSRAAVPFSLQERNANCTHNGLLTFLYDSLGNVSRIAYQVTSETCHYLQIDLWGVLPATYWRGTVKDGQAITRAHREQLASRLPVEPISELAVDYPGIDPSAFLNHEPAEVTTYGFVVDGVHYSGGCETRYGPHPFCAVVDLPSYSLAKSVFAGTLFMWLVQQEPEASELSVSEYVPECRDQRWSGVTLGHLIDMASGVFESTEDQVDEFYAYTTDFINADTHDKKIAASCELFDRRAEPGTTFVYHSTATYIAGTLMNAYIREKGLARDIHRDVLVEQIMQPLGLSPLTRASKRTYDTVAQPFTGYGLTFLPDDIARFALFMMESGGVVGGEQVLSRSELNAALQRAPEDPGLEPVPGSVRYNNGLWALNVQPFADCGAPAWVPYMSGYGGISVALIPNGTVYYVFSDGGNFAWAKAAAESNKINNFCRQS